MDLITLTTMGQVRRQPITVPLQRPHITAPDPRHITKGYGFVAIMIAMGHGSPDTGELEKTRKTFAERGDRFPSISRLRKAYSRKRVWPGARRWQQQPAQRGRPVQRPAGHAVI